MELFKRYYLAIVSGVYAVILVAYFSSSFIPQKLFEILSLAFFIAVVIKIGSRLKIFLDEFEELKTANKDQLNHH